MNIINKDYLLDNTSKEAIIGRVKIRQMYLNGNVLEIVTNDNNLPLKFDVYLVNVKQKDYQKIDFIFKDSLIKINLNSLFIQNQNQIGIWNICIGSDYVDYFLYECIALENELENPKVIKDLQTIQVNEEIINTGIYISDEGLLNYVCMPTLYYRKVTRNYKKINITINNLYISKNSMCLTINSINDNLQIKNETMSLFLISRKTKERVNLDIELKNNEIHCNFKETFFNNLSNSKWDVYLEYLTNEDFINGRIKLCENSFLNRWIKYIELNSKESLLFYKTINGNLSLSKGNREEVFCQKNQIQTEFKNLKKARNQKYIFEILVRSSQPIEFKKVSLIYRSIENKRIIDIRNFELLTIGNNIYVIKGEIKVTWMNFYSLYWDFMISVIDSTKNESYIKINKVSNALKTDIDRDYFKYAIYNKNKIIYPYVTLNESIAFIMRNKESYENIGNRLKISTAYYIYKLFKRVYFDKKNIWIGFEKFSKTAQDNGYAFFSYVNKNNLHDDFYYIIDKKSPDYERIKGESKNIISFMTFKYMLLLFGSKLLISSEAKRHAYNIRIRSDRLAHSINDKKSVFLQHGVTAFKKSNVFKKAKGRGNFNLVVATSDLEKQIITNNWNYTDDEVVVTGFSRWDLLEDRSKNLSKRKIFVMPTWRTWIEGLSKEDFVKTDYYSKYFSLLTSKRLKEILSENNLQMYFFLHPKFKEYIGEFRVNNENIKICDFSDVKVNMELMESSLLISDYSSVTWDMFYMKKPVVFFQFDYEKYEKYEGSHLNMEKELFGDRVMNINELCKVINEYINNDFSLKPRYKELYNKYFKYKDRQNSQRIYNEINKRF